jgi:hypothetical protein
LLTTALLTATTFLAATTALFLAFALLALTFLPFAISLLLTALLSRSGRLAWFVRITFCFHFGTFRCMHYQLLTGLFAVCDETFSFRSPWSSRLA